MVQHETVTQINQSLLFRTVRNEGSSQSMLLTYSYQSSNCDKTESAFVGSTVYLFGSPNAKQAATSRRNVWHLCFHVISVFFALNVWVQFLLNNSYAGGSHLKGVSQKLAKFPFKDDNPTGTYGFLDIFPIANFQIPPGPHSI